jgi:hypothetical protein
MTEVTILADAYNFISVVLVPLAVYALLQKLTD